ncbi:MAG: TRAP transporter small permease subunit [Epsilonproteobacteria bacterium]|nr:TRAP transporter small permease subunit [Campylobacterota bacterium]
MLMILLIINVFYDVISRYFFNDGSIAMQELEWHLFGVIILFGMSYTLKEEGHVRVDFIYNRLSNKHKALINILGTIFFIIPLALFIIYGSWGFVMDSYTTNEISEDPGGLTHRWIIKAMIPISFIYLILTSIGYIIDNIHRYKATKE